MPLTVGASPDDVERLVSMLAVVGRFGHRLGRLCDECVTALEEFAPGPARDTEDDVARQRADDDWMPPAD